MKGKVNENSNLISYSVVVKSARHLRSLCNSYEAFLECYASLSNCLGDDLFNTLGFDKCKKRLRDIVELEIKCHKSIVSKHINSLESK